MRELATSPLVRSALGFGAVFMCVALLARLDRNALLLTGILALPVLVVVGVIGAALFHLRRASRDRERQRQGLCVRCTYDLRGIASARCPECGQAIRRPRAPQNRAVR